MTTEAQIEANRANAQASTGPRTDEGKNASSKNATKLGLFTQSDFIRPGEEEIYTQAKASLLNSLAPETPLEQSLAEEIHRAIWRLRRCGEIEGTFIAPDKTNPISPDAASPTPDPMQNEATAKLQLSVDRARALSHRLLHKCTAELRKLQTDRLYLAESIKEGTDLDQFGLVDLRAVETAHRNEVSARLRKRELREVEDFDTHCGTVQQWAAEMHRQQDATPTSATEIHTTKRTQAASVTRPELARNAPCPCKSGQKYKRCCGKDAPPMLHLTQEAA